MADALLEALDLRVGELVEAHDAPARVIDFARYRDDPVGFAIDVLRVDTLWEAQRAHLRAVAEHRRVAAFGANGAGKTFDDAIIALWWVFCHDGLVVATSAREAQLKEQFMRDVKILFHRALDLPAELYTLALRRPDNPHAGILCVAAGDTSRIRGQHAPRVLVQLQEAQGLEGWVYEAADMMAVGDQDKITLTGNCDLGPVGPFYKRCRAHNWRAVRFDAEQHPNVLEGRTVIPGGPTLQSLAQRASDYGIDSGFYIASVKGEFPTDALEGLVKMEWLDRAFANFTRGRFLGALSLGRLILGVDVARSGGDRTVVCVAQGPVVRDFVAWRGADLEVTSGRIIEIARALGMRQLRERNFEAEAALLATPIGAVLLASQLGAPDIEHARDAVIRIDSIGLGAGCVDRLTHLNWPTDPFNAAAKPVGGDTQEARFANRRAQAFFGLRKLLENDDLALPPTWRDQLVRELGAISWTVTGSGKIIIESKDDVRARLGGASPDFADALAFSIAPDAAIRFGHSTGPIAF